MLYENELKEANKELGTCYCNWTDVSRHQYLSEDFMNRYQRQLRWDEISKYQKMSAKFLVMFKDKIFWYILLREQKLQESILEIFIDDFKLDNIIFYQQVSENFIRNHKDEVSWEDVSHYQKLSESFIDEFQDKVNWINISRYQKLSEDFILKHQDKVEWYLIHKYQDLSNEFRQEHKLITVWDEIHELRDDIKKLSAQNNGFKKEIDELKKLINKNENINKKKIGKMRKVVMLFFATLLCGVLFAQDILDKPIWQTENYDETSEINYVVEPYNMNGVVAAKEIDMYNFRQNDEKISFFQKFDGILKGHGSDNTCECGATSSDSDDPKVPPCSCEKWKLNSGKGWVHTKNGPKCTCNGHHHDDNGHNPTPIGEFGWIGIIVIIVLFVIFISVRIYMTFKKDNNAVVSKNKKSREEMKAIIDELNMQGMSTNDIFEEAYEIGYEDGIGDANIDIDD